MYTICKEFGFEAGHKLDHLPEGHKCRASHGHSYVYQIILSAPELDENGFVVDYAKFNEVDKAVQEKLDHVFLNDVMGGLKTTAELIAKFIYELTYALLICDESTGQHVVLEAVRVSETKKTWAEYRK